MRKKIFYVFDEHTDYIKECERMGMKSNKTLTEDFEFDGTKYKVLSPNECYSGWEITAMALPELSYSELFNIVMNSRFYDEIVGSIGILLKKYSDEFITYLKAQSSNNIRLRKIKKIIKKEISERDPNVKQMTELLDLC